MPSSKSQSFSPRRYAVRQHFGLQVLHERSAVPNELYSSSFYFLNLKNTKILDSDYEVLSVPDKPEWVPLNQLNDTRFSETKRNSHSPMNNVRDKRLTLRIRVPAFRDLNNFQNNFMNNDLIDNSFRKISLDEKKFRTEAPVIFKKLLQKKQD